MSTQPVEQDDTDTDTDPLTRVTLQLFGQAA